MACGVRILLSLGQAMPRHVVPPNAGPFRVVTARAGNRSCAMNTRERKVLIPCNSKEQADELCKQLNAGKSGAVVT